MVSRRAVNYKREEVYLNYTVPERAPQFFMTLPRNIWYDIYREHVDRKREGSAGKNFFTEME
jgi:hypothetical protein